MIKGNTNHKQMANDILMKDADGLSRKEVAETVIQTIPKPIKNNAINQSDFFMVPPPEAVGRGAQLRTSFPRLSGCKH